MTRWRVIAINCAQANVAGIELVRQAGVLDAFNCSIGGDFSLPLAVGAYSLVLDAKDQNNQSVGVSPTVNGAITAPNGQTDLGAIAISIPGL